MKVPSLVRSCGLLLPLFAQIPALAISFDLNCILTSNSCTPIGQSLGTVQIDDISGGVAVTVTTTFGGKYQDLYLNLDVIPVTLESPAIYSSDFFTLAPYSGTFDVGINTSPSKGFRGDTGEIFQVLGVGFNAANFFAFDSLGNVNLAIHLQEIDCTAAGCAAGSGSIKIGGFYIQPPPNDDPGIPEPSTIALVAAGLGSLYWLRRRRF